MNRNGRKLLSPSDASRYLKQEYGMRASAPRVREWLRLGRLPIVSSVQAASGASCFRYTTPRLVDEAVAQGRIPPAPCGRREPTKLRNAVAVELMDAFGLERAE